MPTRSDDELIALANAAADRGELALLDALRREVQRPERKCADANVVRLSGALQIKVDSAVKRAKLPFDPAAVAGVEQEMRAIVRRLDAARQVVHAAPGTDEASNARVLFYGPASRPGRARGAGTDGEVLPKKSKS